MPDPRFFQTPAALSLGVLASISEATLSNPEDADFIVTNIAPLHEAVETEISFLDNKKYNSREYWYHVIYVSVIISK